eukprot:gene3139-biopygen3267
MAKPCTHSACTTMGQSKVDGHWLCVKHGGNRKKPCTHSGCTTMGNSKVHGAWMCRKHGGSTSKLCTHSGCTTMGQSKVDGHWLCSKHGGSHRKPCTHSGCTTMGQSKVDGHWLCAKHGGSTRKPCTHSGCTTMGTSKVDGHWLCVKHGGSRSKPCTHSGCTTMGYSKVNGEWKCVKHGGSRSKPCTHSGCTTIGRKKIEGSWKCGKHMPKGAPSTGDCLPSPTPPPLPSAQKLTSQGQHIAVRALCSNATSSTGDAGGTVPEKTKNVNKRSLTESQTSGIHWPEAGHDHDIQSMPNNGMPNPLPKIKRERLMTNAEHCPAPVCSGDNNNGDGHTSDNKDPAHQRHTKKEQLIPAQARNPVVLLSPAPPTHTKYCSKCGKTHVGSSNYCHVDGTLLSFAKFCPKCEALWPKDSYLFCGRDGNPLVSTASMTQ